MVSKSLNQLAEERNLEPWTSWKDGRPAGYFDLPMTSEAEEFYRENGFLVIENALSAEEIASLRDEATAICRGERGEVRGAAQVTPEMSDEEVLRQVLCIHFPHKISPHIHSLLGHPGFVDVLTRIIGPNVKCMQSMLFI